MFNVFDQLTVWLKAPQDFQSEPDSLAVPPQGDHLQILGPDWPVKVLGVQSQGIMVAQKDLEVKRRIPT